MKRINIDKDKNIYISSNITYFLNPDYVYIPIEQKKILKKLNTKIYKGDEIVSNTYCPISGKITSINDKFIVIENDFRELIKKNINKYKLTKDNIIKMLLDYQESDLLSKFQNKNNFNSIIVNGINDNPYIYNKIFLIKEKISEILEIIDTLSVIYDAKNNLLVIKNNESNIIDECFNTIESYPNIKIALTADEYLLEKEEFLLNKLNIKDNYLYLDINDVVHLYNLINGIIEDTKLITISGNVLKENKVLVVKKYSSLKEILLKYIKTNTKNCNIIANGLMTGYKLDLKRDLYITDDVHYINIMKKEKTSNNICIRCGKCIKICPKKVNPVLKKNINNCIDCGLCTYICPVNINLRYFIKGDKNG